MINRYQIDLNNPKSQSYCKLDESKQTMIHNYKYMLGNYEVFVDTKMEKIFNEKKAIQILDGK